MKNAREGIRFILPPSSFILFSQMTRAMPIGGVNSVRGFRENQLIRDKARIFNVEFEAPIHQDAQRQLFAALVPFYDYGHGRSANAPSATLSSAGVAAVRNSGQASTAITATVSPAKTNQSSMG